MRLYDIEVALVALERARDAVVRANFGEHAVSEVDHLIAQAQAIRADAVAEDLKDANGENAALYGKEG